MTVNLTEKNNNDHITAKDVCAYMYKLGKSEQSGIDSSIFHWVEKISFWNKPL